MKQLSLMIDLNRCIGCSTCIVACRNYHEIIDHTRAMPNEIPYYIRVENRERGVFPDVAVDTWVMPCQHCPDPKCLLSCPERAISKDAETGIVRIDAEACNGCKTIPETMAAEKIKIAPCMANCPSHINVQGYIGLVANGKFKDALALIKADNPFPAVCGRVCYHPCETKCNRVEIDEPVSIRAIHRFLADLDRNEETRYVPPIKDRKDGKVAIIGSGPAGLTCAYYLAQEGYQVTVFEKAAVAGGTLTLGIPAYRLPRAVLDGEIQVIRDLGVEIKTGIDFGKDVTVAGLRSKGYGAFFFGVGSQVCRKTGSAGEDMEGIHPAYDFLMKVNSSSPPSLGKKVLVIGGGNAAIDSARSARRLGAEEVIIGYRRSMTEMPANETEIKEAEAEGIKIETLIYPIRFIGKNNRVQSVEFIKMRLTEPDESGRKKPEPIKGTEFTLDVDDVIVAIGQQTDWSCLTPECACSVTAGGAMKVDPVTLQSEDRDIFAGGDAVTGPRTVIEAIAAGKAAAVSIDRFLRGVDLYEDRDKDWTYTAKVQKDKFDPAKRVKMPMRDPGVSRKDFGEVYLGLTEEMVKKEAARCQSCGCACIQSCPYGVIQYSYEKKHSHKCDLCFERVHIGEIPVCAEVCLTDAITFGERELVRQKAEDRGKEILKNLSRESILYVK
jgi:NADPH-dependent glutamate synthase beta subunit-like oxidoreductase/ferredoxin